MKILLLDTAFGSAPIYEYLKHSGHEVWVMGNRAGDLLAKKAAGNWIDQDYSQLHDVESYITKYSIDYVVPGCTDVSMNTFLQLRPNSHLRDSFYTSSILSNKESFRTLCEKLALPAPKMLQLDQFPLEGQFLCKPVDSFSGRGITVFDGENSAALSTAVIHAREWSPSSTVLFETFVPGDLFSCSAFVKEQRLIDIFYVKEGSSANPFAVDTSYVTDEISIECKQLLQVGLEKICSTLNLKDGLLHCQFILNNNRPAIVEVSRRCPGDLYPLLIEYSTGFRYAANYASQFVEATYDPRRNQNAYILRHTVTSDIDSIFSGLRLSKTASLKSFFPLQAMGAELRSRQGNRAGILFCQSANNLQLLNDYNLFVSRGAYDVG